MRSAMEIEIPIYFTINTYTFGPQGPEMVIDPVNSVITLRRPPALAAPHRKCWKSPNEIERANITSR